MCIRDSHQGHGATIRTNTQKGAGIAGRGKARLHHAVLNGHISSAAGIDYIGEVFVVYIGFEGDGFSHLKGGDGITAIAVSIAGGEDVFIVPDRGGAGYKMCIRDRDWA